MIAQFYAYAEEFTGGVRVSISDGNFDGILDLVTGAGTGGGPEVKGFNFHNWIYCLRSLAAKKPTQLVSL